MPHVGFDRHDPPKHMIYFVKVNDTFPQRTKHSLTSVTKLLRTPLNPSCVYDYHFC